MRLAWFAMGALLLGCGGTSDGDSDGGPGGMEPPGPQVEKTATGLRLKEISLYQSLKSPLMIDGNVITSNIPTVQGRPALIRVFVDPTPEWQPREVVVKLELATESGMEFPPQYVQRFVQWGSTEEDTLSTFDFQIPGEQLTADVGYSVEILEADPSVEANGTTQGARWPVEFPKLLISTNDAGGPLRVVIVPVQYNADGSGRVPDTGPQTLQNFRDAFFKMFPVPEVEITVRQQPMPFNITVTPNGGGWQQLLEQVLITRQNDRAPDNVYYYGLFNPAPSIFQFCSQGGCIGGLSVLPGETDVFLRGSIGLGFGEGFPGLNSTGTLLHEIGHAHGRPHAPCGLFGQPSDPAYPHADARIGAIGYDLITGEFINPNGSHRDVMSYCDPYWVSDFTYTQLFNRTAFVNSTAKVFAPEGPANFRMLRTNGETLEVGNTLKARPLGEAQELTIVNERGVTETVSGFFYPYDHLPGGIVLVEEERAETLELDRSPVWNVIR